MPLPVVAIVGRPNVGKSSLFNRLIKRKLAVIESSPGVTRDRNFSQCDWNGRTFYLVDTGGMVPGSKDEMERLILEQAQIAMDDADVILFVVDCQTGINDIDGRIARELRRAEKPVVLAVNKADNEQLELDASAFYSLGLSGIFPVSAINGRMTGDLLDEIVSKLPEAEEEVSDQKVIRIAVVGRPNVGKSSFVNRLAGENRLIVSAIPGTTRDSVDTPVTIDGKQYILVDTAGLRKRSKVKENIEYYTTLRTIRAIERCEVAVILLDANEGVNFQELKIIEEVGEARRGMVLAINKWDIFEKEPETADIYTKQIKEAMPTYDYLPSIFISALTGQRVTKVLELVDQVHTQYTRRIETAELNQFLEEIVARQTPAAVRGRWIKLMYMTQPETSPPLFVIFSNYPKLVQESYVRYITNQLRERFGFGGVPLMIKLKAAPKTKDSEK
ncbi:MAG: ribosome biogenesis GTPase Der [candidate division Zixibacteria bacterium]|nr:ribosome biogenesis GTPase Der [candidate division Zixibacteria bacterium]